MNIGIMTWYTYYNFGSALQSFALYKTLKNLSHQPVLIKYKPRGMAKSKKNAALFLTNTIWDNLFPDYYCLNSERKAMFEQFINENMIETEPCYVRADLQRLNYSFNKFICGSDQIWSPIDYDSNYFLDFVRGRGRKIAYAPSIGLPTVDKEVLPLMSDSIRRIDWLSVREKQAAFTVREMTSKDAKVVLDPVMLLDMNGWSQNIGITEKELHSDEYILFYFLGNYRKYRPLIKEVALRTKKKIYLIPVSNGADEGDYSPSYEVGPKEFVKLIAGANMVFTDSYHGILFSIIFHRNFVALKRFEDDNHFNQNSRVISILELTNLLDRFCDISQKKKINQVCNKNIDYSVIDEIISRERENSLAFLKEAISSEYEYESDKETKPIITDTCCGCGACLAVCPQGAIEIRRDECGFWESVINRENCVSCERCKLVCPFYNTDAVSISESSLYAGAIQDSKVLNNSSSGGIAYAISEYMYDKGFAVYGCVYDNENRVAIHKRANDKENLKSYQGSKYLQSYSAQVIKEIYANKSERIVFIGTPCQASSVDSICRINGSRENALIVELICHGVPSVLLWNHYLDEMDKRCGIGKTPYALFRDKEKASWRESRISLEGNGQHYSCELNKDLFYQFFASQDCYMNSCYECAYREKSRADIRLGDYWGERFVDNREGVSMILVQTEKGKRLIEELEHEGIIKTEEHDIEEYWISQYPVNPIKPLYYNGLMSEMQGKQKTPLTEIKDRYLLPELSVEKLCRDLHENEEKIMSLYFLSEIDMNSFMKKRIKLGKDISRMVGTNIGIYGYGLRGRLLESLLLGTSINVVFIMDKNPSILGDRGLKEFEKIPMVDGIIITPMKNSEEIKKSLSERTRNKLVLLDEIAEIFMGE